MPKICLCITNCRRSRRIWSPASTSLVSHMRRYSSANLTPHCYCVVSGWVKFGSDPAKQALCINAVLLHAIFNAESFPWCMCQEVFMVPSPRYIMPAIERDNFVLHVQSTCYLLLSNIPVQPWCNGSMPLLRSCRILMFGNQNLVEYVMELLMCWDAFDPGTGPGFASSGDEFSGISPQSCLLIASIS
jgi:hypothetical protein